MKKYWKTYKEKHPYRVKANDKKQYLKNKQSIKYRFKVYKAGAKRRNYAFNLTLEDFKYFWQKPCSYCGDEIKTIGLDRIHNEVGYSMANVVSCCKICNKMKLKLNRREFINKCIEIASYEYKIPNPKSTKNKHIIK